MTEVFLVEQCKKMDRECINYIGVPSIVLMENAAIGIFRKIYNIGQSFLILCGKGNNGGDALALCRHLTLSGKKVKVYIISKDDKYSDDFKINLNILKKLLNYEDIVFIKSEEDINEEVIDELNKYDVTVDGILGVGLNRDLTGMLKKIISYVNLYSNYVVAIDTPSGLDCNVGIERGIAVQADVTYTFEVMKQGFLNYKAFNYLGKLEIQKIGIPENIKKNISNKVYILDAKEYKKMLYKREVYGHKGDYGRALIIAGSVGFTGAAFITTECTVRSGAGLVTLACNTKVQDALANRFVEAMTLNFNDNDSFEKQLNSANSIAFGPGVGTEENKVKLLEKVIINSKCSMVIDADGINILSKNKHLLNKLKGRAIITPHPGEMARLLGVTVEEVESNRIKIVKELANDYGIVVLLKGYNTVISNGKEVYINPTGNSKMASGGMGDALTGIINGFLSQGLELEKAALLGAYIHGKIADKLGKEVYIVNARDIINELPKEINQIIE